MRNAVVVMAIALAASSAFGAVQYEFRQVTQSDVDNIPSAELTGRAIIDGDRSRVEFLSGTAYPPGSYVIATNGSKNLTWVDPSKRAYVEINAAAVANALGTGSKITVANKKITSAELDDHPVIAGMPTDHYKLTLSYDMTVNFGTLAVTQSVMQVVDKWTTSAYANVTDSFLSAGGVHTGNPVLDDLIDAETTKTKGFPLRQTVQITTTSRGNEVAGSPLKVNRTRTVTREFTITNIEAKATVAPNTFVVPVAFHRADPLHDDSQTPAHVLSLEPSN